MYICCIYFLERGILYPYEVKLDPVEFGQILTAKGFQRTSQTLPVFSVISSENFKCM